VIPKTWEEDVQVWGIQLEWKVRWDVIWIEPKVNWHFSKERFTGRVAEIVAQKYLELSWGWVIMEWHLVWWESWLNFLVVGEDKTLNSGSQAILINEWSLWNGPVDIQLIVNLWYSILLYDLCIYLCGQLSHDGLLDLLLEKSSDETHKDFLESIGDLSGKVSMDLKLDAVWWKLHTCIKILECWYNLSIWECLLIKLDLNHNADVRNLSINIPRARNEPYFEQEVRTMEDCSKIVHRKGNWVVIWWLYVHTLRGKRDMEWVVVQMTLIEVNVWNRDFINGINNQLEVHILGLGKCIKV
jgi:hypothetical protein